MAMICLLAAIERLRHHLRYDFRYVIPCTGSERSRWEITLAVKAGNYDLPVFDRPADYANQRKYSG
jgi:hypothetical protein